MNWYNVAQDITFKSFFKNVIKIGQLNWFMDLANLKEPLHLNLMQELFINI